MLYGRLPRVRLSEAGERQARALAERLAPRPLVAVYSSPMLRGRATAKVIAARHPRLGRVRLDRDLMEVLTGWQGQPLAELERIGWGLYAKPRHPEDESMAAIRDRMRRWLARVLRRHAGGEVAGVSHGDPILILVADVRGEPLEPERIFPQPYIAPASLFRLRFDPRGECREIELIRPAEEAAA